MEISVSSGKLFKKQHQTKLFRPKIINNLFFFEICPKLAKTTQGMKVSRALFHTIQ